MVQLHDKTFEPYLSEFEIREIVKDMAYKMGVLKNEKPLFIIILKGSFIFASDLVKALDFDVELCFMQLNSYEGTKSSGKIKEIMGISKQIKDRTLVVVEDIIDTGNTLEYLNQHLLAEKPKKIYYSSLLLKASVYKKTIPIDFVGKEITNEFVVGYGLDYKELGRTLTKIYKLKIS
tara:strand:+ start:6293 stop:6823 length:531 start_codon:yes stop_codon:yes gene_type:complete